MSKSNGATPDGGRWEMAGRWGRPPHERSRIEACTCPEPEWALGFPYQDDKGNVRINVRCLKCNAMYIWIH
jgi:hypothetical protein